jgi:hypothetical protein
MPNYSAQRKEMLRQVFIETGSDPKNNLAVSELGKRLNKPSRNDVMVIARQLAERNLIRLNETFGDGGFVNITMNGIEESERLEKSALRRWPSEHPVFFGSLMSVITGLVMLFAGRFLDKFWKAENSASQKPEIVIETGQPKMNYVTD